MTVNLKSVSIVYIRTIFDQLFRCELCLQRTAGPDWLCSGCRADLPWLSEPLCRCGLPAHAGPCPLPPEAPQPIRALLAYDFPVDRLVKRYKHQRCRYSGQLLARLACCHGELPDQPDVLVPIPLSWRRLLWRGFNQAETLAEALSRQHQIPWRPLLSRRHGGLAQTRLARAQRRHNLAGAFHCRHALAGLHVCLVDDVATTGSTLAAAAAALRQADASQVSAWCLARTLPAKPLA